MTFTYTPQGVCTRQIKIEITDDGKIGDVSFFGGCNGNLKGISALVKGRTPQEVIGILKGIECGYKGTSCPDQLATALEEIEEEL